MNSIDKLKQAQGLNYNWHFKSLGTPNPAVVEFAIALKDLARQHNLKVRADDYGRLEIYRGERPDEPGLATTMFL